MPTLPRCHRLAGSLLLAVVALTGCGADRSDEPTTAQAPSDTEHNDADVAFATDMIPHHAQALAMVDLTVGRPLDPEFEQLAAQIRDAQVPEIETMTDWLTDWGEDIPATVRDHVHGSDHGSDGESLPMDDMPGMMSADDLAALESASDADFQRLWLTMMIEHHEGAVEMATRQLAEGRYRPALDLARAVVDGQSNEIEVMSALLEAAEG